MQDPAPPSLPLPGPPGKLALARVFGRIGCLSFGGPAGQISLMHREVVDLRGWVSEDEYLRALSFCTLLPGPEAMQLASWIGWRCQGPLGGLIAGGLFVLPGAVLILALAAAYVAFGSMPLVSGLLQGLQAAVIAVVLVALRRMAGRALKGGQDWLIAGLAFACLVLQLLPFAVILALAALLGIVGAQPPHPVAHAAAHPGPQPKAPPDRAALLGGLGLALAWAGVVALSLAHGGILGEIALYFSKLAALSFGGAYAALSWMAQEVVTVKAWLDPRQMLDALGLAETTPGPLILVTAFVAFVAAFKAGGWALALAGGVVTIAVTFLPSFLMIFVGAPFIQRLAHAPRLAGALRGISAAVVGMIAQLSLWFALHVLFARTSTLGLGPARISLPDLASLSPLALALGLVSLWLLARRGWPVAGVLALAAVLSAGLGLVVRHGL